MPGSAKQSIKRHITQPLPTTIRPMDMPRQTNLEIIGAARLRSR
jgi:hypothetical protein